MAKKCAHKVADWKELRARVDPETEAKFRQRLEREGKCQSQVIRQMVRGWATASE